MANKKNDFLETLSVFERVKPDKLEDNSFETDEDESNNQVVPSNFMASNEKRSEIGEIKIPDRIWIAFFESMMKITNEKKAEYDQIGSQNAEDVQPLKLVNYIPENSGPKSTSGSESEEPEPEDFEAPITGRPRIELVRFPEKPATFVAQWTWDVKVDNCAICRNDINYLCVECQAGECISSEREAYELACKCNVSQGVCKHVFHSHCILRWLIRRAVCPLCGTFWMTLQCSS